MEHTLFERAVLFATDAHHGGKRKMETCPYIIHPMEVATVVATMTSDENVLAAAVLHDVVEDTNTTLDKVAELFGGRVAELVKSETEDKRKDRPAEETWQIRKEETLKTIKETDDLGIKMLWLGDKLANMRSYYRNKLKNGDEFWNMFHQKDPKMQEWYYTEIANALKELSDFPAYKEYCSLMKTVFSE